MTKTKRTKAPKTSQYYAQLWRVVDGAVADAFNNHPDYLAKREKIVRASVNKRVVGAILGFVEQSTRGRSGEPAAVEPCRSLFGDMDAWRDATRRAWGGAWGRSSPQYSGGAA